MYNRNEKTIIIMVGLPARGKSYISNNLDKYFRWNCYNSKVFNVGNFRRIKLGGFQDHTFFDSNNYEYNEIRDKLALDLFDELINWINNEGNIAIYDATNTTNERREKLLEICKKNSINPLFIEMICNDNNIIDTNLKMKLISKDYLLFKNKDQALLDFKNRLKNYEKIYQTINRTDLKFIKLFDNKKKIEINNIKKSIDIDAVNYLINLRIKSKPIYLSRHGQSMDNLKGLIGGDSSLSELGQNYIEELYNYILKEKETDNLVIFTSILKRTLETSSKLAKEFKTINLKILNEINAGVCEGLTYNDVKNKHPEIYNLRKKDKFNYRYPEGESYKDIVERVKPFILELERIEKPTLVISHNAITRVIYAYLMDIPQNKIPHFDIPLHTIIKLIPTSTGYVEERIKLF